VFASIFRILFALFVIRLGMGIARLFQRSRSRSRSGPTREFSQKTNENRASSPDYSEITPYEIEDADYEELPRDTH